MDDRNTDRDLRNEAKIRGWKVAIRLAKVDRHLQYHLMSDQWNHFAQAMDQCWLQRRFDDLSAFLAKDMVLVAPGGNGRIDGCAAIIDTYREFMDRSQVSQFENGAVNVTERGDTAVLEYSWAMAWESKVASHQATGREILVIARRSGDWKVIWRTQLPS